MLQASLDAAQKTRKTPLHAAQEKQEKRRFMRRKCWTRAV
jgi:hypothetical protein